MFSKQSVRLAGFVLIKSRLTCPIPVIKYATNECQCAALKRSHTSWTGHKQHTHSEGKTRGVHIHNVRPISYSTLDPAEVRKFQVLANKWWDIQGEFAPLHAMNELRVPFIRDNLLTVHGGGVMGRPLSGLRILDVGCGGGLLTEPLGRMGAEVLGVDPVEVSVRTAELHSSLDPALRGRVRYRACTLEDLTEEQGNEEAFDAIVASEVLEHLADLDTFVHCCYRMLKPGGSVFITTISRTRLSYVLGIVLAEQVLRIVPRGTHEWDKFITPVELETLLESSGIIVQSVRGMLYNPLSKCWSWQQSTAVNYALHAVKQKEEPLHQTPTEDSTFI
ncbi:ubiquinone biosynthesis O-methyltransferase, mitochondrial isoform X1 [Ictalurus furcatus]|uniref:ubiquinone biosynthesis O-methyltransferase, mitochondrial isoform X1 n=1 Tax=Ictalurus furcatus TaxID=66913 RepID=UPI00234FBDCA|nr:ubiquinone biosynthesis O-methyltransferase, mitochondrial isoform X1 [Ictalurus furcatus]